MSEPAIEPAIELFEPRRLARHLNNRRVKTINRVVAPRRAAVALVLRNLGEAPEILLIKRMQRERDRWSGHVSFPGGMAETRDVDLLATAVRETHEEVAIDLLACARLLGPMDDQVAMARGGPLPMAITPWVFELQQPVEPQLSAEAEDVFWLPVAEALSGRIDKDFPYRFGGLKKNLPSWRWQGYTVWGLTHRMTTTLIELAREAASR